MKPKYEYTCRTSIVNEKPNCDKINGMAQDGWELVSVAGGQMMSSYCAPVATTLYFKRLIASTEIGQSDELE